MSVFSLLWSVGQRSAADISVFLLPHLRLKGVSALRTTAALELNVPFTNGNQCVPPRGPRNSRTSTDQRKDIQSFSSLNIISHMYLYFTSLQFLPATLRSLHLSLQVYPAFRLSFEIPSTCCCLADELPFGGRSRNSLIGRLKFDPPAITVVVILFLSDLSSAGAEREAG